MDFNNTKGFMRDMAASQTVGNGIKVFLNGQCVLRHVDGYNDLENKTLLTGDELYNIYSCSKVLTVTAAMQLLEKGKYLLTDPLYEYIPEFKDMYTKTADGEIKKAKNAITISDLYTMSAGFTYNLQSDGFKHAGEVTNGKYDTVETIRCMAKDPLIYEPGTEWQYSVAHDVLAALVSVISGRKFRDYVQENIFDPVGMKDSYYHATPEILSRMAEQYLFVPSDGSDVSDVVEAQKSNKCKDGYFKNVGKSTEFVLGEEYDSGGAGIITSLDDYALFCAALANYGIALSGEKILSRYSIELMRTNRLSKSQFETYSWNHLAGYGYGLGVRTHMHPQISGRISNLGEFGWGGAAGSAVVIDPKINLAVFYTQHVRNPREENYLPRLTNAVYSDL